MSKLKFICIADGSAGLCLVYDDGSFINIGGPLRDDGMTVDYVRPNQISQAQRTRAFWVRAWPTVIDVS